MIKLLKFAVRFIVWILLYYIIIYKGFDLMITVDEALRPKLNNIILLISIAMSFMSSFWDKLISIKNIKYHCYSLIGLFIISIALTLINYVIKFINLFTGYVSAPQITLLNNKLSLTSTTFCMCEHKFLPVLIGLNLCFLSIFFMMSYEEYYWNDRWGKYSSYHDDEFE